MNLNTPNISNILKRKLATVSLLALSLFAFATLGDDGRKTKKKESFTEFNFKAKNFSLKTNYNYRTGNLLNISNQRFITLNTTAVFHKGNTTYVLPLKRKVVLDKIKFNPADR